VKLKELMIESISAMNGTARNCTQGPKVDSPTRNLSPWLYLNYHWFSLEQQEKHMCMTWENDGARRAIVRLVW